MLILSIDVGIKNLGYCLLQTESANKKYTIQQWDSVNLCGSEVTCSQCKKKAVYCLPSADILYCPQHAKKAAGYFLPSDQKAVKKMSPEQLIEFALKHTIDIHTVTNKKTALKTCILSAIESHVLQELKKQASASTINLVQVGIAIQTHFDQVLSDVGLIDDVIIENQISPIANRMKTVQGMLAQYFIMRGNANVIFVSSANKLKGYEHIIEKKAEGSKMTYSDRKKAGIKVTQTLLALAEAADTTAKLEYFNQHKKKDDLADCFLQGVWYINKLI
jgi:hypothetical protein